MRGPPRWEHGRGGGRQPDAAELVQIFSRMIELNRLKLEAPWQRLHHQLAARSFGNFLSPSCPKSHPAYGLLWGGCCGVWRLPSGMSMDLL